MPRKHLRSVVSSYQTEDEPSKKGDASIHLSNDIAEGNFYGYDPGEFYLRASDYQGRAISITITVPATYGSAIEQIMESKRYPYKTRVELARDTFVHGLVRRLSELADEGRDVETAWFITEQVEHALQEAESYQRYLDTLTKALELNCHQEHWSAAMALIDDAKGVALPRALQRERDSIVDRYQNRIPRNYRPSYDVGAP